MSAEKSLERIKELVAELRTVPKPERIRKICDDLDLVYNCALMPYEGIDNDLARLESAVEFRNQRIARLEALLEASLSSRDQAR